MSVLIEFETSKMSENPEYWEFRRKFCEKEQEGGRHPLPPINIFLNPTSDMFPGSRPKRPTNEHREAYNSEYTMAITISNTIRVNQDNRGSQDSRDNRDDREDRDSQDSRDNGDDQDNQINHYNQDYQADQGNQGDQNNHYNQDNQADQGNHDNQNNQDDQDDDWEPEETEEDRQWRREYIRRYEEDPERIAFRERYRVIIQRQRAWAAEAKAAEARRRRARGRGRKLSEIMQ